MKKTTFSLIVVFALLIGISSCGKEEEKPKTSQTEKPSGTLKQKFEASYKNASNWLIAQQGKDGFWEAMKQPSMGYTAMVTYALANAADDMRKNYKSAIDKAVDYILKNQNKDDGSFSEIGGSTKTYVTSVVIMALVAVDKEKYKDIIKNAQDFLVGKQKKDGIYKGGAGYGDTGVKVKNGEIETYERKIADLSNTSFAIEALKASGLSEDSEYWKNVVEFLTRCQNDSETNKDPELEKLLADMGLKVGNDGGFTYTPIESKADEENLPDGSKILKSYGSMTYAGLKSFIYAKIDKKDPRVQSAYNWIKGHYTLDLHPGFGVDEVKRTHLQGIFYYYTMFAKALDVWGEEILETDDGKKHKWAEELAEKLISLQKEEGSAWKNESPRWGEGDKILATSYALIAYNTLRKWIK